MAVGESKTSAVGANIKASEMAQEVESVPGQVDSFAERHVIRKLDTFLLPILSLMLLVAFLDRTNIGNAKIQGMTNDLNMKGTDYNIALFMFFIPYIILDIPSNILLKRWRPSIYLPSLMFCWGLITIGEGLTRSYAGLVVCRVLLGCMESGFYPGAIYLLAVYYPRYKLQTRLSIYYSASILSSAFGGLLAYAIAHMDGVGGYGAWRWIFILEGILTVIVAVVAFFLLPDWPHQAQFLSNDERTTLLQMLSRDTRDYVEDKPALTVLKDCLKDPKVYLSAFIYVGTAVTGASSGYFLPTILRDLGWTSLKAQYMSIPVWVMAAVVSILVGFCSDRAKHRYGFVVGPLCLCVVGYAILLAQKTVTVGVRFMAVFFVVGGCFASITISLTWLNNNIVGSRRRGISTAIMLAFGNCGSIVGSNVYLADEAPWYQTGYAVALAAIVMSQLSATFYLLYVWRENKAKERGDRNHLLSLSPEEQDALADKHVNYRYTY